MLDAGFDMGTRLCHGGFPRDVASDALTRLRGIAAQPHHRLQHRRPVEVQEHGLCHPVARVAI